MALVVHSLASGSSGNSILVTHGKTSVLIDAGIGIRKLTAALFAAHVNPADLCAILITHEHGDHIRGAVRTARRYGVPIVTNAPTLSRIDGAEDVPHKILDEGAEMSIGDLLIRTFPISHDVACPVGYSIHSTSGTVVSVTDTGVITPRIREEVLRSDLAILESNHDVEMLHTGPYPYHLKRRITGEKGHVSNDTAAGLIIDIAEQEHPVSVWLAHLSQTNNTPAIALSTAQYLLWTCLGTTLDMHVALRDIPSVWWIRE
ncbi:MAG: MBL fold metallo-hydrolase [Armatimonadetes bacterium]|nr:MBL fold metallo-hydrolase [Armatimonadota bacterium]